MLMFGLMDIPAKMELIYKDIGEAVQIVIPRTILVILEILIHILEKLHLEIQKHISGKARYINSLYVIKVDYSVKVPDRAICREVSTLIEDVMKNTNLEIENNYLKENIKKEYSYNEYCNFLIDRNLLEIFQSRDINPADYSQIIINAVK